MGIEITEQAITGKIGQLSVPSRLGVKTTLGPIQALLEKMEHPENNFRSIHVGGTSGKGSTATFLAGILNAAGYKVGLFTKPHLSTVRERFVINGQPIPPEDILALLERIPAGIAAPPTWFELMTALMFQYFSDQKVDFGVVEVGLGGTFDATNVILPELSILTNVGLDHTDVLGDTVEQIAADKAGIIKPGRPVISGVTQPAVIDIIAARCARMNAPLALLWRDFTVTDLDLRAAGSRFDFIQGGARIADLAVEMAGEHQVANAALAIAAARALNKQGWPAPASAIRDGLRATVVPGRMEILQQDPVIILDGAHSPPKMEALTAGLRALFSEKSRRIGVLSFSKGHDALASLAPLAALLDTAILTEFSAETDYGNKRAQDREEVAAILRGVNPQVEIFLEPDPTKAIDAARGMAAPGDLIVVTGSIFLVGQIREHLLPEK